MIVETVPDPEIVQQSNVGLKVSTTVRSDAPFARYGDLLAKR